MSTKQEPLTSILPLPCSSPDSRNESQGKDSTDNNSKSASATATSATEAFPASAYHFPPKPFVPTSKPPRDDDHVSPTRQMYPLPDRCQFMFSDGRQCTMARSDIHPSLCPYHSEREEQLFGTPYVSPPRVVCGAGFDVPELYSACSDLTAPSGVSRALAQVIRLLAQRRISRQEAATFGHLAHVLLQSFAIARAESAEATVVERASRENSALRLGSPASAAKLNGSSVRGELTYSNRICTCEDSSATRAE